MKEFLAQFSWRDIRNAVFGIIVVFGGLGLAFLTVWAQWTNNPRLAGAAAVASLVFVVLILLFVVPPLARSASREVAQIDLPVELTTGGLIFAGITGIVGFAAWNTGNNLLFLVLAFLLATLAVSFLLSGSNLKKLEAKVRFPEAIFGGEPTTFFIALNNRKFLLPAFSVTLSLRGTHTDDPFGGRKFPLIRPPERLARFFRAPFVRRSVGYFIHVPRRQEIEQQTEQVFPNRGRFIIKDFELSTKFPFGFWQQKRRLKVRETEIFVFPQIADIGEILPRLALKAGRFASNRRGAGQDLLSLRDYQPSDDVRRVDWKATARTGNLTIREFASEDERRVTVIFDSRLPEDAPDKAELTARFENGVSLTAAVVANFVGENSKVRLVIDGVTGDFGADKAQLYECLRRLATVESNIVSPDAEQTDDSKNPLEERISPADFSILLTAAKSDSPALSRATQIIQW